VLTNKLFSQFQVINLSRTSLHMREKSRSQVWIQGNPAIEVTGIISVPRNGQRAKAPVVARFCYVNAGRIYELIVAGDCDPVESDHFFGSFKL
jgi:hypothetical protein